MVSMKHWSIPNTPVIPRVGVLHISFFVILFSLIDDDIPEVEEAEEGL